jgi:hypothetical protein
MKSRKLISFAALMVIVSLSCNILSPKSQAHIADLNSIGQSVSHLSPIDPEAPFPSPGAVQLRTLPAGGSDISALTGNVEAAERAALKAGVAHLKAQMPVSAIPLEPVSLITSPFGTSAFIGPSPSGSPDRGDVLLMSYHQPGVIQRAEGVLSPASVIGLLSSMFTDMFSLPAAFPTQRFTKTETEGDATSNMSMEIGKSEDGSSHFGMGMQSEGTKNGVSVKTDLSATIDGQRCPTAEGQVSFSIRGRVGSETGGVGTTQDLTTFVRAVVNDDAEIASSTFDVIQGTTQVKGGRQVYVESGETIKFGADYTGAKESNWRVNQKTDNVTQEDLNNLEPEGFKAALELGLASLVSAQSHWQDGGCTKIVATSPGTVEPGSTTAIPVNVISIFEGSNAPSKIKTALTGEKSIDPSTLAKTPGTLNYVAPQENGKSATITLTATSRRGRATLQLTANTGGLAYHVSGESNGVSFSGEICINKPFVIQAKFPGGGSANTTFTPADNTSGATTVSGGGGDCTQTGGGTYTVTTNSDGTKLLKWSTTDTLTCPEVKKIQSGSFELPLLPDPQRTCP